MNTELSKRLDFVSERLMQNRGRITGLLPEGVSFVEFHTMFVTACRKTKDIWKCSPDSIFDAALDSALDGLPCDGKHAAIVVRSVNLGTRNNKNFVTVAIYTPMAYGIRKKIIESGAALQVDTAIVYRNEHCVITRGTNPSIDHQVMMDGDRGEWVGVYSVATLPNGEKSIEPMSKADVMAVKESAETTYIWDAHETEMARKTVLRRHAKSLVGAHMMVDIEAKRMLMQIEQRFTKPAAAAGGARPTRAAPALTDESHNMPITDFGGDERQAETVRAEQGEAQEQREQEREVAEEEEQAGAFSEIPQSASEFDLWAADIVIKIDACADMEQVNELRRANAKITAAAPEDVQNEVEAAFTARLADLT